MADLENSDQISTKDLYEIWNILGGFDKKFYFNYGL